MNNKLRLYCKEDINTYLNHLIEKNWIGKHFRIQSCLHNEIEEAFDITGINIRFINTVLHLSGTFIVTDYVLKNLRNYDRDDCGNAIYSMSFLRDDQKWLKFCWELERFYLNPKNCQDIACCFYNRVRYAICSTCLQKLLYAKKDLAIVRLIHLSQLLKHDFKDDILDFHIGEVLRCHGVKADHPILTIASVNQIIDNYAEKNSKIRGWLAETSKGVYSNKESIYKQYESDRQNILGHPFIVAARRWNSWTPNQPTIPEATFHKTGGGYFISDGSTSIAVDPGFGYLKMLYSKYKITVMDIDYIIVTHDHPDHLAELQNILGLRFVYKDKCQNKLNILLNPSSYFLYERMCFYYKSLLENEKPVILHPGEVHTFNNICLSTIGMYHDEILNKLSATSQKMVSETKSIYEEDLGESCSLGLCLEFIAEGTPFKMVIPGDSSFPTEKAEWEKLSKFYANADLAAVHLGSLEKGWKKNKTGNASKISYGQNGHLGVNGVIQLLSLIKPKVAIVTEFGEELDKNDNRLSLIEIMNDMTQAFGFQLIPSDIDLLLTLKNGSLYARCCACNEGFVPISRIKCNSKDGFIQYHFSNGCLSKLDHVVI